MPLVREAMLVALDTAGEWWAKQKQKREANRRRAEQLAIAERLWIESFDRIDKQIERLEAMMKRPEFRNQFKATGRYAEKTAEETESESDGTEEDDRQSREGK
jgi:hypothetical protein